MIRLTRFHVDEGMTTAEYAVGTIAAAGLGGLLIRLITSAEMQSLLWGMIQHAFSYVFN